MEKTAYILYLTVLLISILLFGAMHTYVYTLVTLGVLVATVLVVLKKIRKDYRSGVYVLRVQKTSLNVLFLVMLGFLVFQMVPFPSWVLKMLSPEAWVVWQKERAGHRGGARKRFRGMAQPGGLRVSGAHVAGAMGGVWAFLFWIDRDL